MSELIHAVAGVPMFKVRLANPRLKKISRPSFFPACAAAVDDGKRRTCRVHQLRQRFDFLRNLALV
jgi:hypothetical protein